MELETENDGSICVLVCCVLACCVFLLPIHNHHHHHHRQETWTRNEAAKAAAQTHIFSTYVIYTILLCPSGCLSVCRSVLYMLKLCATSIGPETNLYKHFTEWKPHKRDEEKRMKKKTGSPLKRIYLYFAKENCFRFLNLSFACGMRHAQVRQRVELSSACAASN